MRNGTRTLALVVAAAGAIGGCARLKGVHPAETGAAPHRTGAPELYPDASKTPGATNPQVTQANIQTTICKTGWATAVVPPVSYTSALRRKQLAALGNTVLDAERNCMPGSTNPKCYEEDHFIPVELGGAPRDPKNLWPEPYNPVPGAKEKDWVEKYLHEQVCAGNMTLLGAQHLIVTDWYAVYVAKHHGSKTVAGSSASPTAGTKKRSSTRPRVFLRDE